MKLKIFGEVAVNLFLAILFPVLLYISVYYQGFFIWFAFTPVVILALRKGLLKFWLYIIPVVILFSFFALNFIKTFNFNYFVLAVVAVFFIFISIFTLSWLLLHKIRPAISVFAFPVVWVVLTNIINMVMSESNMFFDVACLQPMLFPLTWLVGSQGITFLIMLVNSLIAFFIVFKNKKVLLSLMIIFLVTLACFVYSNFSVPTGRKIKVALIQANINEDWVWRQDNADSTILEKYKNLSLEAAKSKPDIIVWPEYAIPTDIMLNQDLYNAISKIAKETNAYLVLGSLANPENAQNIDPSATPIKNLSYIFSRSGDLIGSYTSVLPFQYNGLIIPGNTLPVFGTEIGKIGITACIEENSPFINRSYTKDGANLLINLSNDAVIRDQKVMVLKSKHSRASASENHRYLLRVANTGVTEVVNPYGKVEAKLDINKEGILLADIYIK